MRHFRCSVFAGSLSVVAATACSPVEDVTSMQVSASTPLPAPSGEFHAGLYVPINDLPIGKPGDARVIANGNIAISWPGATFDGTLNADDELDTFHADVGLQGALTIELATETSGDLSGSLRLATVALPTFAVGPAIQVSPYAQVNLRLRGHAEAGAQLSMVAPFRVGTLFAGAGDDDGELTSQPRFDPQIGLPDLANAVGFDGVAEVEVTIIFLTSIEGIEIGGPVVGASFGAALVVDPSVSPWWDLAGLVKVVGGWAFRDPVTLLPNVPEHLEVLANVRRDIAEADQPLPGFETSTRWSEVFDVANDDNAAAILPDGNDLLVLEAGGNAWMSSLDGLGAPHWQDTLTTPATGAALVRASDGDVVVASNVGATIRIDRREASGAPLWTRTLTIPDASRVTVEAMVANPTTSGVIIAGEALHSGGILRPMLAAIAADGTVGWATEVDVGSDPEIYDLAVTPSGEIIAVGSVDFTDDPSYLNATIYGENALVLKLDLLGTPLAAFAIGGLGHEGANRIAMHADGSYSIGGHDGSARYALWLATLGADTSIQWWGAYQSQPDVGAFRNYATLTSLVPLEDRGLLIAGDTGSGNFIDAWILRINASGMPMWGKQYSSSDTDDLAGVVALPDGLAAVGSTGFTETTSSYSDLWLIRTNVDGMVGFDPDSGFDAQNTAVQWQNVKGKLVFPLDVTPIPATLGGAPATAFTTVPAAATGELLTN